MYHENKNENLKCVHLTIQFAIMRFQLTIIIKL